MEEKEWCHDRGTGSVLFFFKNKRCYIGILENELTKKEIRV